MTNNPADPRRFWRKIAACILLFAALLPIYILNLKQPDYPYILASFVCFALFTAALLRAVFYSKPFTETPGLVAKPQKTEPQIEDKRTFKIVCLYSALWTVFLWLAMALCIQFFRHPNLPFWDALYADLSVNLDTRHYLNIAANGYIPDANIDSQYIIVFFPLFAWLVRILSFGGSHFITASLLNVVLCAALGPMLYRLVRLDYTPRTACRAVRYLYICPFALFLITPMSESLFLLLCMAYIYCLRTKRWQWLLPLGILASLCRLQGALLAVAAAVEYARRLYLLIKDGKNTLPLPRRILSLAGEALYSVTGLLGGVGIYLGINYHYYGNALHFLDIQKSHWSQGLGFFFNTPAYMLRSAESWLSSRPQTVLGTSIPNLITIYLVLTLLVLAGRRIRLSYLVYALSYYAVTIGATWLLSAPRYMSVLFVLPILTAVLTEDIWYDRLVSLFWSLMFIVYFSFFIIKLPIY